MWDKHTGCRNSSSFHFHMTPRKVWPFVSFRPSALTAIYRCSVHESVKGAIVMVPKNCFQMWQLCLLHWGIQIWGTNSIKSTFFAWNVGKPQMAYTFIFTWHIDLRGEGMLRYIPVPRFTQRVDVTAQLRSYTFSLSWFHSHVTSIGFYRRSRCYTKFIHGFCARFHYINVRCDEQIRPFWANIKCPNITSIMTELLYR